MSLTSQLKSGRLGRWCHDFLTGTDKFVDQVQAAATGHQPIRPAGQVDPDHWATIGGAFGQRLAFLVAHEPPYASYLGAMNAGLLNPRLVEPLINRWPTRHRTIAGNPDSPGIADTVIKDLTCLIVECLQQEAPPGQLATTSREQLLAQACWVLNGWETAYRAGALPPALAQFHRALAAHAGHPSVDVLMLLERTPEDQQQELVRLATLLQRSGTLDRFRALADNPARGQPLGMAQPLFVPHWADGDVIVGNTLLDVKTVITLRDRDRIAGWLWQLLGYAWLDAKADRCRIRGVGLYLARHGVLITWPLDHFEDTLSHTSRPLDRLRDDFLHEAHQAMTDEGAVPFPDRPARSA
ncbi:MAG: hypothetical protein JOZ09_09645 [Pseudonocardiales bacterium]|nr:hypothetical protein [Pseudonocardiales bacterium]